MTFSRSKKTEEMVKDSTVVLLIITVPILFFTIIDPDESNKRIEFTTWSYDPAMSIWVIASNLFGELKLNVDVGPEDISDAFEHISDSDLSQEYSRNVKIRQECSDLPVVVNFSLIPGTGWGHLAYEILFGMLDHPDEMKPFPPLFVGDVHSTAYDGSSPHAGRLKSLLASQAKESRALMESAMKGSRCAYPALHAVDHYHFDLPRLIGTPNIGFIFFDSFNFTASLMRKAETNFDALVVGSSWNAQILRSSGLKIPVHVIRQASQWPLSCN